MAPVNPNNYKWMVGPRQITVGSKVFTTGFVYHCYENGKFVRVEIHCTSEQKQAEEEALLLLEKRKSK